MQAPTIESQNELPASELHCPALRQEIARVIVGQTALVDRLIIGLLSNGHILQKVPTWQKHSVFAL